MRFAVADVRVFRFHLWSCDLQNLKLTVKENICRTALNVMLRSEAKAQVCNNLSHAPTARPVTLAQESFKFIGRGSSEANLKPEQLVILQQYKRAEEVSCAGCRMVVGCMLREVRVW